MAQAEGRILGLEDKVEELGHWSKEYEKNKKYSERTYKNFGALWKDQAFNL